LLTAWTYLGEGNSRKALELVDRLRDENFGVFRDYHAGLIANVANNQAEAARRMKDAYEADKNTLRLVDSYARFLAHRGDTAQAIKIYEAFDQILRAIRSSSPRSPTSRPENPSSSRSGTPRKVPPKSSTGLAPRAGGRAMNSPP